MARHRRTSDRARTARAVLAPIGLAAVSAVGASPLAAAAPAAAPTVGPGDAVPCADTADICVDLGERTAWLADDGVATSEAMPITPGSRSDPTPTGTTTVQRKERHHVSQENGDAPMPYSVFFDDEGRALHSGSMTGASHGCVRLDRDDARAVFAALEPGDEVQIVR